MPSGYPLLNDIQVRSLLEKALGTHSGIINKSQDPYYFYLDPNKKIILLMTPVEHRFLESVLKNIADELGAKDFSEYHVLAGVIGNGLTEKHIVSAYCPPKDGQIQIFDSKISDPDKFFSQRSGIQVGTLVKGLFRSLLPNPISHPQIELGRIRQADYIPLGTQSLFDGASCGYHTATNLMTLISRIENNQSIGPDDLLAATQTPVVQHTESLGLQKNSRFTSFIKKAWQDTFMPLDNDEERKSTHFGHYFMGWPKKGAGSRALYFLTLGFITTPVVNLIRLPTEFLFNALSEIANYLKNALISWAPTNYVTQSLRSVALLTCIGLQGLFKGVSLLLRTVTAPVTSFKEALNVNPPWLGKMLAATSALFSLGAFAALIIFAAPVAISALSSAAPGVVGALQPIMTALAYPIGHLFTFIGVSIAPITAALSSILVSIGLITSVKEGAKYYEQSAQTSSALKEERFSSDDFTDISHNSALDALHKTSQSLHPSQVLEELDDDLVLVDDPDVSVIKDLDEGDEYTPISSRLS
jgi:hypothetical protein